MAMLEKTMGNQALEAPSTKGHILGYRPDEMIGRSGADFINPEDLEPTAQEFHLLGARGSSRAPQRGSAFGAFLQPARVR
jgi:hypothetical protein